MLRLNTTVITISVLAFSRIERLISWKGTYTGKQTKVLTADAGVNSTVRSSRILRIVFGIYVAAWHVTFYKATHTCIFIYIYIYLYFYIFIYVCVA